VAAHRATLIPGDGVGPELVDAARRAIEATGVEIGWDVHELGATALERDGSALPDRVLESIRSTGVALKGPVATPVDGGFRSVNVGLRVALDLYACVRPCRSYPGVPSRYEGVDHVIVRETTEGS
jgi:isocitrate dehydrogenase (NAD+)